MDLEDREEEAAVSEVGLAIVVGLPMIVAVSEEEIEDHQGKFLDAYSLMRYIGSPSFSFRGGFGGGPGGEGRGMGNGFPPQQGGFGGPPPGFGGPPGGSFGSGGMKREFEGGYDSDPKRRRY